MGKSAKTKKRRGPDGIALRPIQVIVPRAKPPGRAKPGAKRTEPKNGKAGKVAKITNIAKAAKPKPGKAKAGNAKGGKAKRRHVELVLTTPAAHVTGVVLDRLFEVVLSRRDVDPAASHSARLLSRGTAKVAQKFGEEAVECLIEAVAGNADALVAESADVLYHLLVLWVAAGVRPDAVWAELTRREGVSGIAEKAARPQRGRLALRMDTSKIP